MFTEKEAKDKLLKRINDQRPNQPPFEITDIRLSSRKDWWIMGANVIDPFPKYVGVYGYLLNNDSGEIIVCGADQFPDEYIQDQYDLEEAAGRCYVLYSCLKDTKSELLRLKQLLGVDYKQAMKLIRDKKQWFQGKKRHVVSAQKLLAEINVVTSVELVKKPSALVLVEGEYWWRHQPLEALRDAINVK